MSFGCVPGHDGINLAGTQGEEQLTGSVLAIFVGSVDWVRSGAL